MRRRARPVWRKWSYRARIGVYGESARAPKGSWGMVTATDLKQLHDDTATVLERYWPGVNDIFQPDVYKRQITGHTVWPPDRAKRRLSYRPRYNFPEFVAAYKAGNTAHYPFAGLPWWGV
jgi:hypothetical protein